MPRSVTSLDLEGILISVLDAVCVGLWDIDNMALMVPSSCSNCSSYFNSLLTTLERVMSRGSTEPSLSGNSEYTSASTCQTTASKCHVA